MFDWWERLFDYALARAEVRRRCQRQLWHLFDEAQEKQPADPSSAAPPPGRGRPALAARAALLPGPARPGLRGDQRRPGGRPLGAAGLARRPLAARGAAPLRQPRTSRRRGRTCGRQTTRARRCPARPRPATPTWWRSSRDGCLENGEPRRYEDLRRLNDGLRERGRARAGRLPVPHAPRGAALAARAVRHDARATSATCCCSTSRPASARRRAGSRRPSPRRRRSSAAPASAWSRAGG